MAYICIYDGMAWHGVGWGGVDDVRWASKITHTSSSSSKEQRKNERGNVSKRSGGSR
jgi:hypothetical protein